MKAKGGSDAYNEAFRFLKYSEKARRIIQAKSFFNWKQEISKEYYLAEYLRSNVSKSKLMFISKQHGNVTIPFASETPAIVAHALNSFSKIRIVHNGFVYNIM